MSYVTHREDTCFLQDAISRLPDNELIYNWVRIQ